MSPDCCVCNKDLLDKNGKAPENWSVCINCINEGYFICEADRKVFNCNEVDSKSFKIDKIQSLIFSGFEILKTVNEDFFNTYMNYKKKVCCNNCYNILYLSKCIEKLKSDLSADTMVKIVFEDIPFKHSEEGNKKCIDLLNNKIKELEILRKQYMDIT